MALDPLATVDDLQSRLIRTLSTAERTRATVLLGDASAAVRGRCRQIITQVADDTVRLRPIAGKVRLPQRPVTAVASVAATDSTDLEFRWNGADVIELVPPNPNLFFDWGPGGYQNWWQAPLFQAVDVTYTHGYEEVPGDLLAVVCQIAGRAFGIPADMAGESSRSVDGYVVTTGAAAASGPLGMLPAEQAIVDSYRRRQGTVRLA